MGSLPAPQAVDVRVAMLPSALAALYSHLIAAFPGVAYQPFLPVPHPLTDVGVQARACYFGEGGASYRWNTDEVWSCVQGLLWALSSKHSPACGPREDPACSHTLAPTKRVRTAKQAKHYLKCLVSAGAAYTGTAAWLLRASLWGEAGQGRATASPSTELDLRLVKKY